MGKIPDSYPDKSVVRPVAYWVFNRIKRKAAVDWREVERRLETARVAIERIWAPIAEDTQRIHKKFFDLSEKWVIDLNKVIVLESEDMMFCIVADAISGVCRISRAGIQPSLPTQTCIRTICKSERN